jgi:DNA-binding response OmpR family regulator
VLRRYNTSGPGETRAHAAGAGEPTKLMFDGWVLDTGKRELTSRTGSVCELTTGEYDLLMTFLNRPGRVLSRDNIMDCLKGHEWSPYDRSIDSLVVRLRRKIEPDPEKPTLIKTVRGVGYVLAVETKASA